MHLDDRGLYSHAITLLGHTGQPRVRHLSRLTMPTLLVAGGPTSHLDQSRFGRLLAPERDVSLVEIPAGHRVHSKAPTQFAAAVARFLVGN